MIALVKGADYVLLVTEPTPAGLHDLHRVMEAIAFFRIPSGVILNRAGLSGGIRKKVLDVLEENDIPLLAEVSCDVNVPRALSERKSVITAYPEAPSSKALVKLSGDIELIFC